MGEPVQANGTKGRDSPEGPASNSPWQHREAGLSLLWETRFPPVALAGVGDRSMFNPPQLGMNYSKKLKKKKTPHVVN